MPKKILQSVIIGLCLLSFTACSFHKFTMGLTSYYIQYQIDVLNNETDLQKIQQQLPEFIESLEQLITENQDNKDLRIYAAQAYYSYAFSFIEDSNVNQAAALYYQSYSHAIAALELYGIVDADLQGNANHLNNKINSLNIDATAALYWTALSWAKLIEIKQPNLMLLIQFYKPSILMEKVIALDDSYHYFGAYLFFAVYYAALPFYLGGDESLSMKYFNQARNLNSNRLLIIDYLQVKYLNGRSKGHAYKQQLENIVSAPEGMYPEQSLMNAVAKQKASNLLSSIH